jgi:D-aminopeptidase
MNAEMAAYLPGVKRLSGNTVLFTATDMTKASKFLEAVTGLEPATPTLARRCWDRFH